MKLLFYDGFDKCSKCIYLLGIELLELIGKSIHSIGRFLTEIEKFLWSYVEVLTYIKEVRHGRKGSSTFDFTNISGIFARWKDSCLSQILPFLYATQQAAWKIVLRT